VYKNSIFLVLNSEFIENVPNPLENQFIYPYPRGSKLIFLAPLEAEVNEENQKT
jgi:hypothetical protein